MDSHPQGALVVHLIGLAYVCHRLHKNLEIVPERFRKMPPGHAWLLLIPVVGVALYFYVLPQISRSYRDFFEVHGRTSNGDCGETVGWVTGGVIAVFNFGMLAIGVWLGGRQFVSYVSENPLALVLPGNMGCIPGIGMLVIYLLRMRGLRRQAEALLDGAAPGASRPALPIEERETPPAGSPSVHPGPPSAHKFALQVIRSDGTVEEHGLGSLVAVVGRGEDCTIRLEGDVKASRRHCMIELRGDAYYLTDLGARNGTRLNGEKIGSNAVRLRPDDVVGVGGSKIVLRAR